MVFDKNNYLTESKLSNLLKEIYPSEEFEHDKKVPNSDINLRPDYRSDELKLIVEFDGYRHYSVSSVISSTVKPLITLPTCTVSGRFSDSM